MIFLVDKENEFAEGLCRKLNKSKPNGLVELSAGEMDLYLSDRFKSLSTTETGIGLVEIKSSANYMYVISGDKYNMEDVSRFIGYVDQIGSSVHIIRTRG